ncbi:MAG: GNAT family N-acetyltransferase [Clostridia bacterium]|nr:GNAT family N-acetyltransferase [Clostridia bacterium]
MTQQPQTRPDHIGLKPVLIWQDAVILSRLARQIWLEHYTPIIGRDQVDYMTGKFQSAAAIWRDIQSGGMEYDLIVCGNQPAGYMAVRVDSHKKSMFLSKLYVERARRGQGIGRWAFGQLVDRARKASCSTIWLTVNRYNSGSIAAYQKLGFHIMEAICTDIGQGYVMDDFRMEYRLS